MSNFHDGLEDLTDDIEDYDEDKYTPDYEDEGGAEEDATDFFEGDEEFEEFEPSSLEL